MTGRPQLCFVLVCFAALASIRAPRQTTLVEITPTPARYERLRDDALRFFRAVGNGDKPTLARLAPPASRDAIRTDLDDPTSPLARMLLTGARAMRGKFMSVQTPRMTFLRERGARAADDRVIVCFSDSRQEFTTPATPDDLPGAETNRAEICLPFVLVDRQWLVVLSARP